MKNSLQFSGCALCSIPHNFFQKLTDEDKKLIEANSVIVNYRRKEVICKQGSLVDHFMYVEKGLVKVFIEDESATLLLRIITDNDFIGLEYISEQQQTYPYSAIPYTDCTVRQIEKKTINEILLRNTPLAKEIIEIVCSNSIRLYGRFFCLNTKNAYGMLAEIILCLGNRVFDSSEFELPFSKTDLAELSGMRVETLSRMLKKFINEGLISLDRNRFVILDYDRLLNISLEKKHPC